MYCTKLRRPQNHAQTYSQSVRIFFLQRSEPYPKIRVYSTVALKMAQSSIESFQGHRVAFANRTAFFEKLTGFKRKGHARLSIVSDFDFTISKFKINGARGASCHKIIEDCGLLHTDYHIKAQALQRKYYPLEVDPDLNMEEKISFMIEWVEKAHVLLQEYGLTKDIISSAVAEALQTPRFKLRGQVDAFFELLASKGVPTLIFSAGIADILQEILSTQITISWNHVHVISNRCLFDEQGSVTGFELPLLHVFNKRSSAYLHTSFFQVPDVPRRDCLLLLGDSLGDISMSEGMGIADDSIIKIGFLNDREERLPEYLAAYDLVVLDDPDFTIPIHVVTEIFEG